MSSIKENIKSVEFYKKGDCMIYRDKYLNQLIKAKNDGFPKVITGVTI